MKKTKIKYEDIKAGDLIEVVANEFGVKSVYTGIAFEKVVIHGGEATSWDSSEGGTIVGSWEEGETIYRIDVREVQFDDIKKGDKLRVTTKSGNVTTTIEGMALAKIEESISPYWCDQDGHLLVFKHVHDSEQVIEILEAGE